MNVKYSTSRSDCPVILQKNNFRVKAWLQLLRIANLPTAFANILMAFLIVHQAWNPTLELLWLLAASSCFYLAGMVLNDVFDLDIDTEERPERPIPAGKISLATARTVGFGLLAAGLGCCALAGLSVTDYVGGLPMFHQPLPRCVLIGTLLLGCILLYDGPLKRTILAPWVMGLCRTMNILLGASTFIPELGSGHLDPVFGLPLVAWWIAASVGVLIAGTTLLGRNEAKQKQNRLHLAAAAVLIAAGLAGIATLFLCPHDVDIATAAQQNSYLIFLAFVSVVLFRRVIEAVVVASPKSIQTGVVAVLRSLILLDGAVCFLFANGQYVYPLTVAGMLIPAIWLGRFIRST